MDELSRRDALARMVAGAAVLSQLPRALVEEARAARVATVQQTLSALVGFVVPDRRLRVTTTKRLTVTLDRFLPGLAATAASILNSTAAQVKPGATFAQLNRAQKAKVFETLEGLRSPEAGSIRFLAGNLAGLTSFLAYSTRTGWKLSHYAGVREGRPEFKGYFRSA